MLTPGAGDNGQCGMDPTRGRKTWAGATDFRQVTLRISALCVLSHSVVSDFL